MRSADPAEAPEIRFNYMSHPDDWAEFRACVRLTREIFEQKAFSEYKGHEIQPGKDVVSDEAIDAFIREHADRPSIPAGRRGWDGRMILWRWSIPNCG
ncbi:GMC oxidoreductase [Paracoccus cavernae]|uniref:GMC oxidoreductase n=1 Tax=Paracoccus cavernae TaxID=1571207 RepID=A0ABT8D6C3_9RHOB|nr:GMC oxidoreductase [Paracoccus cavernae]